MPLPLKTFIIYSQKDKSYKDDLMKHLRGSLILSGHLEVWHDSDIVPGEAWEKKIEEKLADSDLFLVLLSIDSITSEFIRKKELATALARKSRIVPILVRDCYWKLDPIFAGLQGLPAGMLPHCPVQPPGHGLARGDGGPAPNGRNHCPRNPRTI